MIPKGYEATFIHAQWWVASMAPRILGADPVAFSSFQSNWALHSEEYNWVRKAQEKLLQTRSASQLFAFNTEARELGRRGEEAVCQYLLAHGWDVTVRPTADLRPKYGTSTVGYDIIARHGLDRPLKIEVKTVSQDSPEFYLGEKCVKNVSKTADILVFVRGDEIFWSFVKDLKISGKVYSLRSETYPEKMRKVILYTMDKGTFLKAV